MTPQASTPGERGQRAAPGRSIRIRVGDARLTARLDDNAPANHLAAQPPPPLTFRDHNSVEKTAPLSRELSLEGVPAGHDPVAGDIGYWAQTGLSRTPTAFHAQGPRGSARPESAATVPSLAGDVARIPWGRPPRNKACA